MPAALALKTVLPTAIQYQWICDGKDTTIATRTQAELVADCPASSAGLKAALENATDETWTTKLTALVTAPKGSVEAKFLTDEGRSLQVKGRPGLFGMVTVELRLK